MKFLKTNNGVTVFADKPYTFSNDHESYERVLETLRNDDENAFMELVKEPVKKLEQLSVKTKGKVEVSCGEVVYEGKPIHNVVCERILSCVELKLPVKPLLLFLENLMDNPSMNSVDQLYPFLEHNDIPITEDGCFLAYKRVDNDWKDLHSGTFSNKVGNVVKMLRNQVDDNPANHCSQGFHAGSMKYVNNFGSGGHVVIVKINPRDVVSVPSDHNCTKIRVCEYLVVDEYKGDLLKPLYDADVNNVSETDYEEWCDECGELVDDCECDDDYEFDEEG